MTAGRSIVLRGMTWNHTRGYVPLIAATQRFHELHPEVDIVWERRTLKAFEAFPIEQLAREYDLIVIDHPFIGEAAERRLFLPLDDLLPAAFLAEQAVQSVGASFRSYQHDGRTWALAIDAATPVAVWREDLLRGEDLLVPHTWDQVVELARRGRVEFPAAPINCLMNLYSFCLAEGEEPFAGPEHVVSHEVGCRALERLRDVLRHCDPGCWERNPIGSHERLASASPGGVAYCPLAYGYSNYARRGYAEKPLSFGLPPLVNDAPLATTLGGTGLALSALRENPDTAARFAQFAASGEVQRTLYVAAGGQPAHRSAWIDEENNRMTGDAFRRTLPALETAYLRPRYNGHVLFQEQGAPLVHAALRGDLDDLDALRQLDARYRQSRQRSEVRA